MNAIKKCFLFAICVFFSFSSTAVAAPVTPTIAESVGATFSRAQDAVEMARLEKGAAQGEAAIQWPGHVISDVRELKSGETGDILAYVFALEPKGFVVVSPDTDITPVIAYSFEGDFNWEASEHNALLNILTYDMKQRMAGLSSLPEDLKDRNQDLWARYFFEDADLMTEMTESATYGPLLSTTWDQSAPYNNYCPVDPNTGSRSVVGCVATAMAQIVNYHACTSSVTFTSADNYTTSTRKISINASTANISGISYPASDTTAARLSYACGVSVQMDYTSSSSGAMTSDVAAALKNKFGFTSATAYAPQSGYGVPVLSTFYEKLRGNVINGNPAQLAIAKSSGGGHSIVCDGYNSSTGQYHLNYGWGSSSPSPPWWYTLPSGMPSGYDILKYGVLDIRSSCHPSCPDLYSWNGGSFDRVGPIFMGTHSPLSEQHQKLRVKTAVEPMGNELVFKIKEIDGEESYINSVDIYCSLRWVTSDKPWLDKSWVKLQLLSATHNTLGDVTAPLREKDEKRLHTVPGDEVLLRYAYPGEVLWLENPQPYELEFRGWSSGYYLWQKGTWAQAWTLSSETILGPGEVVIFDATINNMTTRDLPEGAEVWFVLGDEAETRVGPVSVSKLPPATPTPVSFAWQVPASFAPGTYGYAARVYVGDTDITWDQDRPTGPDQAVEGPPTDGVPATVSGCSH
jgi:hypothetical protein